MGFVCVVCGLLLGENNKSNQLLGAGFNKVLVSMLSQTFHKVENCLAAQNLMAHIKTQHDAGLILQDAGDKTRPDGQPAMKNTGQMLQKRTYIFLLISFPPVLVRDN